MNFSIIIFAQLCRCNKKMQTFLSSFFYISDRSKDILRQTSSHRGKPETRGGDDASVGGHQAQVRRLRPKVARRGY